jgi:hypothetical protein
MTQYSLSCFNEGKGGKICPKTGVGLLKCRLKDNSGGGVSHKYRLREIDNGK